MRPLRLRLTSRLPQLEIWTLATAAVVAVALQTGCTKGVEFGVSEREIFVDHSRNGRSGHMGHALVDAGGGRILDFYSNCDGRRCDGHSGFGWMEYRISEDYGKTRATMLVSYFPADAKIIYHTIES